MELDRDLFASLTLFRTEFGWGSIALFEEPAANRVHRRTVVDGREPFDKAVDCAMAELSRAPEPALRARSVELLALLDAWRRKRPAVDAAFDQSLASRDPSLRSALEEFGNRFLSALEDASDATEAQIQRLDPEFGSFIDARAATWLARTSGGRTGILVSELIASGRAVTREDWTKLNTAETESLTAWRLAERTVEIGGLGASVRAAFARAKALNFGGQLAEHRAAVVAAASTGHPVTVSAEDWQPAFRTGQKAVADAAIAAIDAGRDEAVAAAIEARRNVGFAVATIVLALGLIAAAIVVVQVHVVRRLFRLADVMRSLAAGQLETQVPGTRRTDEIGDMAVAVQVFKDNLIRTRTLEEEAAEAKRNAEAQRQAAVNQVAEAFEQATGGIVGRVSSSAGALQATAQIMVDAATETAERSTTVAAAADQAASNVGTVAVASEELGASVREISRQVSRSTDLARAAVDEANQTAELVQALMASVARIDEVVGMIAGVAAQTNLLALNATIEAARAGEAGRGFAVVAAEVKALADQTAKATEEISRQIGQVQGATGQAVSAIERIGGRIREINGVAASIAAAVEEQEAATQEIVRNVGQAAAGTSDVTSNITGVAGAAEKTGVAADQVLRAASELSHQSEHLRDEVQHFLAAVRAA